MDPQKWSQSSLKFVRARVDDVLPETCSHRLDSPREGLSVSSKPLGALSVRSGCGSLGKSAQGGRYMATGDCFGAPESKDRQAQELGSKDRDLQFYGVNHLALHCAVRK